MNQYGRAHYDLDELKKLLSNEKTRRITHVAQKGAVLLGYITDDDIVERCLILQKREIYKTMPSHHNPKLWQDVYKTADKTQKLYIKLQKNEANAIVISFKTNDD